MSKKSLVEFAEKLELDEEWSNQFANLSPEEFISRAQNEGFDFTMDELATAMDENANDLDESELEQVAGGRGESSFVRTKSRWRRFNSFRATMKIKPRGGVMTDAASGSISELCPVGKFDKI